MTLPDEIRTEFARIRRRYEGLPDALASIRVSAVERIEAHLNAVEERINACTCEPARGFEIDTRRNAGRLDFEFNLLRLKRMRAEDAAVEAELFGAGSV